MRLGELTRPELSARLTGPGLSIRCGPFVMRLRSPLRDVADGLADLYADHPVSAVDDFADFAVSVGPPHNLRRWVRRQVRCRVDGIEPFQPLPRPQAYAMLEWTMNWWIAGHAHQFLVLHAAVVERGGQALVLPGPPGTGKSTLCAGLVARDWRLLSDELTLIMPEDGRVSALARPISLKNASIDVIRGFAPSARIHATVHGTAKGAIAHMRPPAEAVRRVAERARPGWIIFLRYDAGAAARLTERARGEAMIELGRSGFNYGLLGRLGFDCLADFVAASDCYDFTYGRLDEATALLAQL